MHSKTERYIRENEKILKKMKEAVKPDPNPRKIDHNLNGFIEDGIICPDEWFSAEKKVMFFLKEAYNGDSTSSIDINAKNSKNKNFGNVGNSSVTKWIYKHSLEKNHPIRSTWYRISEWTYGILHTTIEERADYNSKENAMTKTERKWINQSSIVNIKKSDGKKRTNHTDLAHYSKHDAKFLRSQIELISPDVIICGNTGRYLNNVFVGENFNIGNGNKDWVYKRQISGKGVIIIDYYHPGATNKKSQTKFNEIVDLYQRGLKI